ncbi:BLOC-3 complex member HPS4 isoform X2 [Sinocyclocheilus grahami]|uniref:BLOC-3 complex member HPS4 isoform X1 n=1 Tax=Sinocyclocheilus grahami TaxID=75366 RepID=UPI0007AC72E6|nr:PREDICTED: Hermansky-Pudlak syndrome 4 protein homolog isoform X1 [Sinocyclocheilus grahami]XP_016092416.1 PREDICTED: Hermansky-Pudlak syndrome 4 protein homolog isoform X2 [Sinocyclocheilus grahami]
MQPMAETAALTDSRRFFFLYDSLKVQEEGDLTRDGIYYFSPEDTPVDQQELLCGQLAGVCRCVSEMSSSPVRLFRLRKSKYAVRMKDSFLWALSCVVDIPDVSVCDLLDQLIALFCFYNGPVRQSYQLYSKEELALRWARYLCHLQGGSTELHNIFSCLRTIDSTHIDPLLLLKAALILQACQRCPLVLAGCILYRGRVVSTQMPPALTVKVMVYETQTYSQDFRVTANGLSSSVGSPSSFTVTTQVFLTPTELYMLRCYPVDRACRSHCNQPPCQPSKSRLLSRTLSDTPTTDTDSSSLDPMQYPPTSYQTMPSSPRSSLSDEPYFSPSPSRVNSPLHSNLMNQSEYFTPDSHDHSTSNGTKLCAVKESLAGLNIKQDTDANSGSETKSEGLNSDQDIQSDEIKALTNGYEQSNCLDNHSDHDNQIQNEENNLDANNHVTNKNGNFQGETEEEARTKSKQVEGRLKEKYEPTNTPSPHETLTDTSLVPSVLYQHRVRGLVLALLVEPEFNTDPTAREEVHHSSLASLNGLEAHLRNTSTGTPGPPGPYTFAHYDCIQNTLTTNVCVRSAGPQEAFVRATKLLHSHFSHLDTLQEAIVRNGSSAVYGTRSTAQETYFLQQGTPVRNSGSPDPQDSAFSLPRKARQRLLKHGVNLL